MSPKVEDNRETNMEKTDNELIEDFYVSQGGKPSTKADLSFYESDWNMLMPVVEKISKMYDPDYEDGKYYDVNFAHELFSLYFGTPINEVYAEVIKSIKWYNTQTLNHGKENSGRTKNS